MDGEFRVVIVTVVALYVLLVIHKHIFIGLSQIGGFAILFYVFT